MGRTGKTSAQHKRDGTFRAHRHGGSALPVCAPEMPADMGPKAESCWKIVVAQLVDANAVSEIDGKALRLLCEADAIRLDALDELRDGGPTIMGQSSPVMNPAARVYFAAWDREERLLRQFGMTPVARRGLNMMPEPDVDDSVARILKLKEA